MNHNVSILIIIRTTL